MKRATILLSRNIFLVTFLWTETRHHQPPPPPPAFLNGRKTLLLLSQTGQAERKPLKPHFTFILLLLLSFFRRGKTFENWRHRKKHRRKNAFFHSKVFLLIRNKVLCSVANYFLWYKFSLLKKIKRDLLYCNPSPTYGER